MNKLAKGAIATAIGTALLLGGGATLALSNDAANVGAAEQINTGVLTLDVENGAWSTSPELWVPGDSFTYTTDVSIVAQGDNLVSQLAVDPQSITGDPDLIAALDYSLALSGSPATGGSLTPAAGRTDVFDVVPTNPTSGTRSPRRS